MLKSNKTVFDKLTDQISSYIEETSKEFVGAGYWKLHVNGYVASPLLEDWVGVILLVITGIYMLVLPSPQVDYEKATTKRSLYEMLKEIQTGVTLAFMIPINLSSFNCIYGVISSGMWTLWEILSLLASFLLIAYYVWFALYIRKRISPDKEGTKYEISDIYYHHLNFDFSRVFARVGAYYFEYYIFWVFTIVQTIFSNRHIAPLIIGLLLYMTMFIMSLATPIKSRSEDFSELNKINKLKKAVILLRILLIGLFFCFMYFMESIDLAAVKVITAFCFVLLGLDIIINFFILYVRGRGLCRTGIRHQYARMNEDYVELEAGHRNQSTLNVVMIPQNKVKPLENS